LRSSSGFIEILLEGSDLGSQSSLVGLEHAALGIVEAGEVRHRGFLEPSLKLGEMTPDPLGGRAQGGGALVFGRRDGAPRVAQERLAGDGVGGGAPGGNEGQRLARAQRVAADRIRQRHLHAVPESAKRQGDAHRLRPRIQAAGFLGAEASPERQAPAHPRLPFPQEFACRRNREAVLIDERLHHTRLIHGAQRACRCIGVEEPCLQRDALHVLDDRRDLDLPAPPPRGQTLEAIEDLEETVFQGRHANWQGCQAAFGVAAFAPQRLKRRAELLKRDCHDELGDAHADSSGRSRI
jgi:hypothetical protein